jgi:hypothetical protein
MTSYIISLLSIKVRNKTEIQINFKDKIPGIWDLEFNFTRLKILQADKINFALSAFIIIVIFGVWSIWY